MPLFQFPSSAHRLWIVQYFDHFSVKDRYKKDLSSLRKINCLISLFDESSIYLHVYAILKCIICSLESVTFLIIN